MRCVCFWLRTNFGNVTALEVMKGNVKLWQVSVINLMLLMSVAVHNAVKLFFFFFLVLFFVRGEECILSSSWDINMYVLHLTEVLLINTKMKPRVSECWREKLWLPLNIKQHVSYKDKCFSYFLFFYILFLVSVFSNTTEPKGHFIDHSEVMSPDLCLFFFIYLNVVLSFQSTYWCNINTL